jgi:hypothetical protein
MIGGGIDSEGEPLTFDARLSAIAILVLACGLVGTACTPPLAPDLPALPSGSEMAAVSFQEDVRPVLDRRCVVCHACYDAACQLQLSSYEGLDRGATRERVYDSSRLTPAKPSRLFVDAKSTDDWRDRGFHSVLDADSETASTPLLLEMLALGRARPFAEGERLPASVPLDISRKLSCPSQGKEFDRYVQEQPQGGMPYAMASLPDPEIAVLSQWVSQGAPPPPEPEALPAAVTGQIETWETFLNGDSLKEKITARYLFEHWFLAHLRLEGFEEGPFFQIVRSSTPLGQAADEIPSRWPYSNPGQPFWYRLVPIRTTIVHKTHIPYPLGASKLARLRELFFESDWQPARLPDYDIAHASNPFVSFDQIPPRSRYQFLLDDAQYFVMSFIRGPVCRGQVAVDVIEDHFFVAFADPDRDPTVVDFDFLDQKKDLLRLPAEHASHLSLGGLWLQYDVDQRRYLNARAELYDRVDPERLGPSMDWVWDGNGTNANALLTVFRHFDNASVVQGWLGEIPKTAWVMDFPILERLYYDLVAGFDVFGNVTHQLSTRTYMDHLRMQSEINFLSFLPAEDRQTIRASWYVGATRQQSYKTDHSRALGHGTQIAYESDDPKAEFIEKLIARNASIAGAPDLLNRCVKPPCDRPDATTVERRTERVLQKMTGVHGPWVAKLPEVTLLRIRSSDERERDAVYTLIHNRAHTNVSSLFREQSRLIPQDDTLLVMRGFVASYPNFLFEVPEADVEDFGANLEAVQSSADFEALTDRFGVRRTSGTFWQSIDWLHADFRRRQPSGAGILDLARYGNH